MDQYTIRDTSFHWLCRAMGFKAEDDPGSTINLEFGYGGARLLDCRWLGPLAYEELVNVLFKLQEGGGKLNVVGSSAGSVIAASLAVLLPVRRACCGFDPENRKRSFKTDANKFERATNLRIPTDEDRCACDTVRRIYDFLFEMTALSEHPSWHDYKVDAGEVENVPPGTRREPKTEIFLKKMRSTPVKQLKYDMIADIFEGTRTVESTLYFSDEVASAFTLMYANEPLRYATVLFRIVNDLQGKMMLAYMLSRYLLTQCLQGEASLPPEGGGGDDSQTYTIHLGSKNLNTNEFVFTDITQLHPLTRFLVDSPTVGDAADRYEKDAEAMNEIVIKLMASVDMRDMAFPVVSDFIWKRKSKMLNVRGDEASREVAAAWLWDGTVPSYERYDSRLLKRVILPQNHVDIMTGTREYLPNYAEAMGGGSNYIFELSPLGKHLFSVDEMSGLFEACTPGLNTFQLKTTHNRTEDKISTLIHGTPFVARV